MPSPCLLLLALPLIQSGGVQGRITLPGGAPARDAAVSLQGAAHAAPLRGAQIDQRGKTFLPHVLVVPRGTRVGFPNNDLVLHNVFAQFDAKKFDLGLYPRGATAYQVFDKPGIVAVRCNIHAQMSAYIIVVDTPYYATADRDGRFQIAGVPPGTYQLRVWHESGATLERTVTIPAGGGERLDLPLTRR